MAVGPTVIGEKAFVSASLDGWIISGGSTSGSKPRMLLAIIPPECGWLVVDIVPISMSVTSERADWLVVASLGVSL